jgi:methylated-DNA-[protein]-cysteine S-methyltransferase
MKIPDFKNETEIAAFMEKHDGFELLDKGLAEIEEPPIFRRKPKCDSTLTKNERNVLTRKGITSSYMTQVNYTCIKSSFGWVGIASSVYGLIRVVFGKSSKSEAEAYLLNWIKATESDSGLSEAIELLTQYFNGERVDFALNLDLRAGTDFQQAVWEATRKIPYGEVRSYGFLAKEIGKPKAARAVGSALGANPLPIIVPCHRVLRSDGGLGGYSGGLCWKPKLLAMEGVKRNA